MTLLLLEGTARGPKTAAFGDWPGQAIFSPADHANEILNRPEFDKPGVYVLKRDPKHEEFQDRVYIGQGSVLRTRIKNHLSKFSQKPFNEFVAFSSSSSIVHAGTIDYLEHRLVSMARGAKSSEVENKQSPKEPPIPEADRINMEAFLGRMKIILPVFGFRFLEEAAAAPAPGTTGWEEARPNFRQVHTTEAQEQSLGKAPLTEPEPVIAPQTRDLFRIVGNIAQAFMYMHDDRFVVTKGSQANKKESASIGKNWVNLRRKLLLQKILIDKGSHYEFTADAYFDSTSAASSVILGRQTSGPISWIHLGSNLKYGEMLAKGLI